MSNRLRKKPRLGKCRGNIAAFGWVIALIFLLNIVLLSKYIPMGMHVKPPANVSIDNSKHKDQTANAIGRMHTTSDSQWRVGEQMVDPHKLEVHFSDADVSEVKKRKVFLSKGNSRFSAQTVPWEIHRVNARSHQETGLSFIVLGDWGAAGRGHQLNVSQAMHQYASSSHEAVLRSLSQSVDEQIAALGLGPLISRDVGLKQIVAEASFLLSGVSINASVVRKLSSLPPLYCQQGIFPADLPDLFDDSFIRKILSSIGGPGGESEGNDDGVPRLVMPTKIPTLLAINSLVRDAMAVNASLTRIVSSLIKGRHGKKGATAHERGEISPLYPLCLMPASNTIESRIDFIVSVGDNIYEAGAADARDSRFVKNYEKVYVSNDRSFSSPLHCPWLLSLGNHDHGAHGILRDVQGQVNYTFVSSRWYLPSTFYVQRVELFEANPSSRVSIEFYFIDSYEVSPGLTRMSVSQMRWLEASLNASAAQDDPPDWRFLVGHRPIYSSGTKHGSSAYMLKRLHPLMERFNISAFLCGDDHNLQVMRDDASASAWRREDIADRADHNTSEAHRFNALYLLSGGGSRAKADLKPGGSAGHTVFQTGKHGFISVRLLNPEWMVVNVVGMTGDILFSNIFRNAGA